MAAGASASETPSGASFGDAVGSAVGSAAAFFAAAASRERRSDALRVAAVAPGGLSFIPDAFPFFKPPVSVAAKAAARSASAALRATAAASRAAAFCSRLVGARGFASRGAFAGFSFGGGGAGRGRTRQSSSFSSRRFSVSRPGIHTGEAPSREAALSSALRASPSGFFFSSAAVGSGGAHSSSAKRSVGSTRIFSNCASRSSADQGEKPCLSDPRSSAASASADHQTGSAPRWTTGHVVANSASGFSAGGDEDHSETSASPAVAALAISSAFESAALSLPHLYARCHPLASLLYRLARSSATSAFSGSPARRSSIAASHTSTVCSQVARDMPTGTPPSSTPPPRASISAATAGGSFRHERGAVSVPQRPFFMLSHTSHRASAAAPPASPAFALNSACSRSSSSARALFTLAVRSIISARHDATARACLNGRRSDIASSAALVARTHAPSTPTPKDTSASSRAFRSLSSHASVFLAASFLLPAAAFREARFAPRVARSSSSSEKEPPESSPEKSSSSPRRRRVFLPTIPAAPSLYESYVPLRLRGPVTRKRSSRAPPRSSRAARAASGSALAQKSSASKSSSSPAAENTAVEKVFPARAPMARCSARSPRI